MTYRNATYAAFYVAEPFSPSGLGAFATPDFCHYQMLRMWKAQDATFPFVNAHDKTYDVRDGSSWEGTLRPRLRERLRESKNIVLFLSLKTRASRALTEEMEYGVGELGLPVIVVYPNGDPIGRDGRVRGWARDLWNKLPAFRDNMDAVPTLHVPMEKGVLREALLDPDFMVQSKCRPGSYHLT